MHVEEPPAPEQADIVAKYKRPIMELMLAFGDELLDGVHALTSVNVEDVRRELLGPLRHHLLGTATRA